MGIIIIMCPTNFIHILSVVPPDSILVDVTTVGSMLAGSEYNLMCTVTKSNTGLTGSPSAEWIGPNGNPVVSTTDITVESLLNDTMTSSLRLRFARLHTSFSGLYTCLGVVPSPAVEGEVTASDNSTVTVKSENGRLWWHNGNEYCFLTQFPLLM